MTDLAWLSIAEASRLIAARKLSSHELTAALLARIDRLDSKWHAFIRVLPERAGSLARVQPLVRRYIPARMPCHEVRVVLLPQVVG